MNFNAILPEFREFGSGKSASGQTAADGCLNCNPSDVIIPWKFPHDDPHEVKLV
jgi:hypothetical protein